MNLAQLLRRRSRSSHHFLLDPLESRTLLSGDCFGGSGSHDDQDEQGDNDQGEMHGGDHSCNGTSATPISDLTGNGLTFNQVVGVSGGGFRRRFFSASSSPDIATITSASTPVKLCGYSVSIDWGDGTAPTRGFLVVDKTDPTLIHVKGSHAYQTAGDFNVNITVTLSVPAVQTTAGVGAFARHGKALGHFKKHATTTIATGTLMIASTAHVTQDSDTGLDVSATTGQSFTGSVGTFTLPAGDTNTDPASFTAIIKWGDSMPGQCSPPSLGTVTLNADGSYTVSGTHTYNLAGTYRITIVVLQNTSDSTSTWGGWCQNNLITTIYSTATVTDSVTAPPTTTTAAIRRSA